MYNDQLTAFCNSRMQSTWCNSITLSRIAGARLVCDATTDNIQQQTLSLMQAFSYVLLLRSSHTFLLYYFDTQLCYFHVCQTSVMRSFQLTNTFDRFDTVIWRNVLKAAEVNFNLQSINFLYNVCVGALRKIFTWNNWTFVALSIMIGIF